MPTSSTPIGQASNDGYVDNSSWVDNSTVNAGDPDGFSPHHAGFRFSATGIPNGATITTAKVTFKHNTGGTFNELRTVIKAELGTDNPSPPADVSDYWARNRTSASASWNLSLVQSAGDLGETADFAPVLQEVVDQALWNENQAILLFIENNGSDVGAYVSMLGYDAADVIPTLVVEYEATGPVYGELAGTIAITLTPTATLTGLGALSGTASITIEPTATLTGYGNLSGTSTITLDPSATLTGIGNLSGSIAITLDPSATLSGYGDLAGEATISILVSGDLTALPISGPFRVLSGQAFAPGAITGYAYAHGATSGQSHAPGAFGGQFFVMPFAVSGQYFAPGATSGQAG